MQICFYLSLVQIGQFKLMILHKFQSTIISPTIFHLNFEENGDPNSSTEDHLRNHKTSRGSYLDLGLSHNPVI
jgi:hypothetical protein